MTTGARNEESGICHRCERPSKQPRLASTHGWCRNDEVCRLIHEAYSRGAKTGAKKHFDRIRSLKAELETLKARGLVLDQECRCGSGGHPRHCDKHPHRFEMHVREINEAQELEELREEVARLRPSTGESIP